MTSGTPDQSQGDRPQSVLHRKAQAGRVEHQTRAMSVAKALRLTLAKVADEMFDMAMAVIGVRSELRGGDALKDIFSGPVLLMSLDGPSGGRAAAVIDAALVGGLIQQQTMGKVMPDTASEPRQPTVTDAAICAPFLDELLKRAALLPETEGERALLQGFQFGTRAEDARVLKMTLEAPEYQVLHITVDIAGGLRQGQLTLCMPTAPAKSEHPRARGADVDTAAGAAAPRRQKLLNGTVMGLHVDLNIALAKLTMPLSALGALVPGDVLNLGVTAFDQSRVLTMAGVGVGRGTLGQIDGVRALRVDHQKIVAATPKRRASDRADLDLPEVSGDGTGTRAEEQNRRASDRTPAPEPAGLPDIDMAGLPELPGPLELPDMSDLPEFDDEDFALTVQSEAG